MARRNDHQRPGPSASRRQQVTEIVLIVEKTILGTDLDVLLRALSLASE
jgi:hypothetical protein